ncbi:hypothetical protein EDD15DRAFT_2439179 [Pisolithus albus]|nr:hypothetical protein EDD15DRAFT_2439179 [Pisolithus albus]
MALGWGRRLRSVAEQEACKVGAHPLVTAAIMSSFENVRPGMSPRFLNQKMKANDPEKKMPSTAAKPRVALRNVERSSLIRGPLGFPLNVARNGFDGVEEVFALSGVLNIRVDEQRVNF